MSLTGAVQSMLQINQGLNNGNAQQTAQGLANLTAPNATTIAQGLNSGNNAQVAQGVAGAMGLNDIKTVIGAANGDKLDQLKLVAKVGKEQIKAALKEQKEREQREQKEKEDAARQAREKIERQKETLRRAKSAMATAADKDEASRIQGVDSGVV